MEKLKYVQTVNFPTNLFFIASTVIVFTQEDNEATNGCHLLIFLISFLLILTVVAEKRKTQNLSDKNANQSTSTATKKKPKTNKPEVDKIPSSDAILSCPACMTTLCIDCQRLVKHLELFPKICSNS